MTHGFQIATPDGTISNIDYPGATDTDAWALNNELEVVGDYSGTDHQPHGYFEAEGVYTGFNVKGSLWTAPDGIDASGNICGTYSDDGTYVYGFVRNATDGSLETFAVQKAVWTWPVGIGHGVVTGYYEDTGGDFHGFVRAANGTIKTFDIGATFTDPTGISAQRFVTGYYSSGNGDKSFVLEPG